jgi:anti-anti-sigma factor
MSQHDNSQPHAPGPARLQSGKLKIRERDLGQVAVIELEGEVRLGKESVLLRDTVRYRLDSRVTFLLIDLAKVTYMDSSGVGLLVEFKAHAVHSGGDVRLCNCPAAVAKILSRLMLHNILTVYANEESALAGWG